MLRRRALAATMLGALAFARASAAQAPTVLKELQGCMQPCFKPILSAPGFTTITYRLTITNNEPMVTVFRIVDDIPAGAIAFRVIDRGDGAPCGTPGNPTCANLPAPGGANGAGQVVIDNFTLGPSGGLGSTRSIVLEVDFSCPPTADNDSIANQARVTVPARPTLCNPCFSDNPVTPAAADPTVFIARCVPPPPATATKDVDQAQWVPTNPPVLNYTITITNPSTTDVILGSTIRLVDRLPTLANGSPAFDPDPTCPITPVVSPPATLAVDNDFCDQATAPNILVTGFPNLAPGASITLTFPITILDWLPDGFQICNDIELTQTGGGVIRDNACTTVVRPIGADLRTSTKEVSPTAASIGDPIVYIIVVSSTGTLPANNVVLRDFLPPCLDASRFNPATDIAVSPGPFSSPPVYDPGLRELVLEFASLPSPSDQVIVLGGLTAGSADPSCCNQAFLTADGITAPGQPTSPPGAAGQQTCLPITPVPMPDFSRSAKTVSPSPADSGAPVTYTIDVTNSGTGVATNVVLNDPFPGCIDTTGFDYSVHVTGGIPSYNPPTLRVDLGSLGQGATARVTITGLRAGLPTAQCCNQAFVSSSEVAAPGQPTEGTPGAGDASCIEIRSVTTGCDLNRESVVTPGKAPGWVYAQTCAPTDQRLADVNPFPGLAPGDLAVDTITPAAGWALGLYQFDCGCSSPIKLYKRRLAPQPTEVRLVF